VPKTHPCFIQQITNSHIWTAHSLNCVSVVNDILKGVINMLQFWTGMAVGILICLLFDKAFNIFFQIDMMDYQVKTNKLLRMLVDKLKESEK